MDLHYSQTISVAGGYGNSFTTLWIYTILKLDFTKKQKTPVSLPYGFTLFSNQGLNVYEWDPFHYLMDLHYSQTPSTVLSFVNTFHYLMDLHYSQTTTLHGFAFQEFHYLMDLHYSQTGQDEYSTQV